MLRRVVALVVAVSAVEPVAAQDHEGASRFPCAAPLAWRIARVDDGFGIDAARATVVVREATEVWERAVDRRLFVHDPDDGFPIRLVFDERQQEASARISRETELAARREAVRADVAGLEARRGTWEESRAGYDEAQRDVRERTARHNEAVRAWNARGEGTPPAALVAEGQALQEEQLRLGERFEALERELGALRREEDRVSSAVRELDADAARFARDFPVTGVEAGTYREFVRTENGDVTSVSREIRLYRFESDAELRLVAAHELGHALGLAHETAYGAIMSAQHVGTPTSLSAHPTEAARLAQLCQRPGRAEPQAGRATAAPLRVSSASRATRPRAPGPRRSSPSARWRGRTPFP